MTTHSLILAAALPTEGRDDVLLLAESGFYALLAALVCAWLAFRNRRRPRARAYVLAGSLLALLVLGLGWGAARIHSQWTQPPLAFDAPAEACLAADIPLDGKDTMLIGARCPALARYAQQRGLPPQEAHRVLAIRGHELERLEPNQWHGVYVTPQLRPADPARVYFYLLNARYISAWGV